MSQHAYSAQPCSWIGQTGRRPLQIGICKKVKASHVRYWALGPELIPVYRQSARIGLLVIHPAVGLHYCPPGLRLPSQPQSITAPWPVPSYTAWWQRHIGVNNLPKVITQLLPRVGFEPTTCWSQVQRSTRCATAPPKIGIQGKLLK